MRIVETDLAVAAAKPLPTVQPERQAHLELLVGQILQRLRLAVVYGGNKSEPGAVIHPTSNPRSWKSYDRVARDIAEAMARLGCQHVELIPDDMQLGPRLKDRQIQMVWLNTGGVQGLCSVSHGAAMLELFGLPYIGHDPLTAALLDNKYVFKRQLKAIGIPTAPFIVWHPGSSSADPAASRRFKSAFAGWDSGFVVKPVSGRASLHVHYVENAGAIARTANEVFERTRNSVLIEAFLPGREFCIAVTGPTMMRGGRLMRLPGPMVFAGVERMLEKDEHVFTSMDIKPITEHRVRALDPAVDALVLDGLEKIAATLYREMPLKTLVRLDVRSDENGRLFVLEANPKPDLKAPAAGETSLIAVGLDRLGMSYDDLIHSVFADRIVQMFTGAEDGAARLLEQIEQHAVGGTTP